MDEDWGPSFSGGSSFGAGRGRSFDNPAPVGKMASLSVGGADDDWNSGGANGGGGWGSGANNDDWNSGTANGGNGWGSASNNKSSQKAATSNGGNEWGSGAANGDDGWGSGAANGKDGWGSGGGDSGWGAGGGGGWGSEATAGNSFDGDSAGDRSGGSRGRGRGRGRGGGSGGDRSCYKCGEEGHMSRDCPSGGGGGRGGSRGGFGGRSGGDSSGGSRACYKCGEEGHMSRECPNGDSGGGGRGSRGGFGGGFGSRGGGDSTGGSRACYKCGEEGHMSRECPSGGGGGGGAGGPRTKGCFNCGSEDHSARDCDQDPKTRAIVGEDGKTREIYVPKDISEDSLFSEGISSGINFSRYQNIPCQVTGRDVVEPIVGFEQSGLRPLLLENIKRSGYTTPTPVQRYAVPIVMAGRDMMACAQTGSGKTAAFLLPILHELLRVNAEPASFDACQKPRAVIVSPTRELAMQIHNEARKFGHNSALRCVVVYGGTSTQHQSNVLQRGCDVLVATPGRLLDFVDRGKVQFERLRFLVLDEADRMLDMGFQGDVERITHHPSMPDKLQRHTLLFSATFPEAIQRLAGEFLNNYLFVSVGVVGAASQDVVQTFCEVSYAEKRERLESVLADIGGKKTLVFVELKRVADFIASHLCQRGFATTSIHGDRLQREREEALADFKHGSTPTLIATSVASRGLDIKGVANVVNYDLPKNIDDYVHRIGRTGRVGNVGNAISFYDSGKDAALAPDLVKILAGAQQEVPDFLQRDADGGGGSSGAMSRSRDIRGGFGGQQFGGALPQGFNANQPTQVEEEESWN